MTTDSKAQARYEEALELIALARIERDQAERKLTELREENDSWDTGWFYTDNGGNQQWGGTCAVHGTWEESAA